MRPRTSPKLCSLLVRTGSGAALVGISLVVVLSSAQPLRPSDRESLERLQQKLPSPCGKPHSLLTSTRSDPGCRLSPLAVQWMALLLEGGSTEEEVEGLFTRRFLTSRCYDINTTGAQVRGDPTAPVSLIEFADFECEHCRRTEPLLRELLSEYRSVKLVFMNFPQPMHANAPTAAAAALAAGRQGRFWEYHDKVFTIESALRTPLLLSLARALQLDLSRFRADLEVARSRVAWERAVGERLELVATPSFFIGCKKLQGPISIATLRNYVEAELAR